MIIFYEWGGSHRFSFLLAVATAFRSGCTAATCMHMQVPFYQWSNSTLSSTWQINAEVVYHRLEEGDILVRAAFYKYVGSHSVELLH